MMSKDWREKPTLALKYPDFFVNDDLEITMKFYEVCQQSIPANAVFCPCCGTEM